MRSTSAGLVVLVFVVAFSGCGGSRSSNQTASLPPVTIYVATTGSDSFSGTLSAPNSANTDGPFLTLSKAVSTVRGHPGSTVQIRNGTYFLPSSITFDSGDSGNSGTPTVYENFPSETPVISGGTRITGWTDAGSSCSGACEKWTVSLPSSMQNFEALYYNDVRRYRPRTTSASYLFNAGPVCVSQMSTNCPNQTNRCNNQFECFDRFQYSGSDVSPTFHSIAIGDVEILNFENWTVARMRLTPSGGDSTNPCTTGAGVACLTGMDSTGPFFGFHTGHRLLIDNTREDLNSPQQWYLDRCPNNCPGNAPESTWTLTYLAAPGEDPNTDVVIVPQQAQLIVANGLSNVTFRGITFSHDNFVAAAAGQPAVGASTNVPAALSFTSSSYITFDSCTIAHIQGFAVEFVGTGSVNATPVNQVVNSSLYDLGTGGIRIGQLRGNGDNDSNVAQSDLVQNNVIEGGGRFMPGGIGTAVWVGNAHHNTIIHNDMYDWYNGAIGLGATLNVNPTGDAHDNIVSFNHLHDLGQGVTSDMGCVHVTTSDQPGNQILNNKCHDVTHDPTLGIGYGGQGIYLDQGASRVTVMNNLVYRVSANTFFDNNPSGGHNNTVSNNIFAYGREGIFARGGDEPLQTFSFTHNLIYYDMGNAQGGPQNTNGSFYWFCEAGPCTNIFDFDSNMYFNRTLSISSTPNVFFTTDGTPGAFTPTYYNFAGWQSLGEDVHSTVADPGFNNPTFPADDYSLSSGSTAPNIGFVPFDVTAPGRTSGAQVPKVPPAFPLQLLSPSQY